MQTVRLIITLVFIWFLFGYYIEPEIADFMSELKYYMGAR